MPISPHSWPPLPSPLARWWYAPRLSKSLAAPYHAAPRIALIDQWVHGFRHALFNERVAWLERLFSICEADPGRDPLDLLTRFIKRMLQAPGGVDVLLDMRSVLQSHRHLCLGRAVDEVIALLFHPGALQLNALDAGLCRLQWPVYFGSSAFPAYLAPASPDLRIWQFVHPLLQRPVLWLPLRWAKGQPAWLEETRFMHSGLQGIHGGGAFIRLLFQALDEQYSRRPTLCAHVRLPVSSEFSGSTELTWIKQQPLLVWHIQQGAQLGRIQQRTGQVHCHLRYEFERLAWVQSEWGMGRVVRA